MLTKNSKLLIAASLVAAFASTVNFLAFITMIFLEIITTGGLSEAIDSQLYAYPTLYYCAIGAQALFVFSLMFCTYKGANANMSSDMIKQIVFMSSVSIALSFITNILLFAAARPTAGITKLESFLRYADILPLAMNMSFPIFVHIAAVKTEKHMFGQAVERAINPPTPTDTTRVILPPSVQPVQTLLETCISRSNDESKTEESEREDR